MKKLLMAALLCVGLPACETCGPFEKEYFDIIGVQAVLLQQSAGGAAQILTAGQSVVATSLHLRVLADERLYSMQQPTGGFAALACDYPSPLYTEVVDSLVVTSRNAYDAQHPAGAPLNDLLEIRSEYNSMSLGEWVRTYQVNGSDPEPTFQLRQPPAQTGPQQFRVRYRLTNGEVYTAETVAIQLIR